MIDLPEIPEVPLPPIQKIIKESPDIAQWFLLLTDVVNKIVDKVNSL